MKHVEIKDPRTRQVLFYIGIVLIAFGAIGIATHAPWGDASNFVFTFFGTMISFAQFSVGFTSLKPADKPAAPIDLPNTATLGLPQTYSSGIPLQPGNARLTSTSVQILLGTTQLSLGRSPDNQQVLNNPQVSGHHAIIRPEGQGYALLDQHSTNGTWVNGQRLAPGVPHILRSGDFIRIGDITFTYETTTAPENPSTVFVSTPSAPPTPIPAGPKRYIGSGIAFLLAGLFNFIYALLIPFTLYNISAAISAEAVFGIIYILGLCGIHALYQKQAHRAGLLGILGTLILTSGWILNVVLVMIYLVIVIFRQHISPDSIQVIQSLLDINAFLIVIGDIILGISMIRADVYPLWTSILLIVIGFLVITEFLAPTNLVIALLVSLLVTVLFCGWGIALIGTKLSIAPSQ